MKKLTQRLEDAKREDGKGWDATNRRADESTKGMRDGARAFFQWLEKGGGFFQRLEKRGGFFQWLEKLQGRPRQGRRGSFSDFCVAEVKGRGKRIPRVLPPVA